MSTYGAWWIKQSIRRALANQSKTIRLPSHMVEKISRMRLEKSVVLTGFIREIGDALAALDRGLHVMVEKPMGTGVAAAERILRVCRENKVLLSVCYCMRYWSVVRQARELIELGGIGKILGTEIVMLRDRSESYLERNTWQEPNPNWHGDRARSGGGMFLDNFSHYLDYFHFITGLDVEWVFAKADTFLIPADVEDTMFALCGYDNGASGMFLSGSAVRGSGKEGSIRPVNSLQRIWGEYGQIVLQPNFSFFSQRRTGPYLPNRWHHIVKSQGKAAGAGPEERARFVDMFARAVLAGEPLEITGEDGYRVMSVMDAVYRSAVAGTKEKIKGVNPI